MFLYQAVRFKFRAGYVMCYFVITCADGRVMFLALSVYFCLRSLNKYELDLVEFVEGRGVF